MLKSPLIGKPITLKRLAKPLTSIGAKLNMVMYNFLIRRQRIPMRVLN